MADPDLWWLRAAISFRRRRTDRLLAPCRTHSRHVDEVHREQHKQDVLLPRRDGSTRRLRPHRWELGQSHPIAEENLRRAHPRRPFWPAVGEFQGWDRNLSGLG